MKTDLSLYDNTGFDSGAKLLKRFSWYLINILVFKSALFAHYGIKVILLRLYGAEVGQGVKIKPAVNIKYPWKLKLGNHIWIGENVWIDNLDQVSIGDNCCLSQGVLLLCGNHNYKRPGFDLMTGPIHLEAGVWLGANSTVCPHVRCGEHAVLTVGSIATSNLEAFTIHQGNPAVGIKKRIIAAMDHNG